jgi:hypothetical protein
MVLIRTLQLNNPENNIYHNRFKTTLYQRNAKELNYLKNREYLSEKTSPVPGVTCHDARVPGKTDPGTLPESYCFGMLVPTIGGYAWING